MLFVECPFCGCNDYISSAELFWIETGQCMADYNQELRQAYLRKYGKPPNPIEW